MKQAMILLGVLFLASCTTKTEQSIVAVADMPAGAVQEPFEDNPNMVKITVSDATGNTTAYGISLNGLREGSWTELHPNGHVKNITGYVHGLKEGQSVEIDNRGQLLERFTYHKDKLEGPYTKYNRSRIKEVKNYKNGLLEGKVEIFYDNAKMMEESYYKNGKRDGIAKWFDQEGNLSIEYTYVDGEWIKDEKE